MSEMDAAEWDALKAGTLNLGAASENDTWVIFDPSDNTWVRPLDRGGWTNDLMEAGIMKKERAEELANGSCRAMSLAGALAENWMEYRSFNNATVGRYLKEQGNR